MVHTVTLKKATAADINELKSIATKTFIETYTAQNTKDNMRAYLEKNFSEQQLETELSNPDSAFYFALLEQSIVGYLKINFKQAQTEFYDKDAMEIERIYVLEAFQGNKIGSYLCQQAIHIAQKENVSYVWLGVWEQNPSAISFYKKNGFLAVGTHIFRLGNDEQTDIIMKLIIT